MLVMIFFQLSLTLQRPSVILVIGRPRASEVRGGERGLLFVRLDEGSTRGNLYVRCGER